ncbi:ABC transporter ATP-binding protein [Halobacterium jilantaiense]|uniref:Nickel import system ATP-binding protein NikD n=1 Tax=Halobacterium jilantaiense TaxID=355548 RepID=A0A1I0NZR1_9EURY|nr:ABC transporter ATP-binding protein [Halobacterium jilantaiense]SEW07494.1 peptide/nickel transport system ATP-binding protein [Halobacterium jilantaiense]
MRDPLLSVDDLHTQFDTEEGTVKAVDGVSFDVREGETVCLVGESGSGKTVACESITRLVPQPPGRITGGEVRFDGEDLTELSGKALREYRGGRIGHVFQNPQEALDPVYTVGDQLNEAIRLHRDVPKSAARERAVELLDRVGIGDVSERIDDYPHQFSGGMKQRVVIAMALACDPDLLIADEPTTALDVTIQAQVLRLLDDLQNEHGMAMLFVTHDLGVVAEIADRVVVMYAGKVMETGSVYEIFEDPSHPYTRALLECLPGRGRALDTIGGSLPEPTDPPDGCRFHPRCPHAVPECETGSQPAFRDVGGSHDVSCLLHDDRHDLPRAMEADDD